MNARKLTAIIDDAYTALRLLCDTRAANEQGFDTARALDRALDLATSDERMHRRFMGAHGRYRVSVPTAARYMVVRHVFLGPIRDPNGHTPANWRDAASTRKDCVQCYAIQEALTLAELDLSPLQQAAELDYAKDLAI